MKGRTLSLFAALLLMASAASAAELSWRLGSLGAWWKTSFGDNDFFSNTVAYSLGLEARTDIGDSNLALAGANYQRIYNRQSNDDEFFRAQGFFVNVAFGHYLRKGEKLKFWAGPELVAASWDGSMNESGDSFTLRRYGVGGAFGIFLTPIEGWTLGGRVGLDYSFLDGHGNSIGSITGNGLGSYLLMGFDF